MISRFFFCLGLLFFSAAPASAFYSNQEETLSLEARALLTGGAGVFDSEAAGELSARLMTDIDANNWHIEYHQVWQQTFISGNPYHTQADRLNMSFSDEAFHIKFGRQAVNLATTFYFSPNDFFAPFFAQTFNRDYKQGVDAAYAELQLGELSQASAVLVNNENERLPTSSILRFESTFDNMAWMVLIGEIYSEDFLSINPTSTKQSIVGASLQTDLFDTVGVRAEGHISKHGGQKTNEWVLGLDYFASPDLTFNAEWFNHGAKVITANLPYTASAYLALGLSYTFTPLLSGSFSSIFNMDDQSQLHTAYFNYSLSNESTFNAYILQPTGSSLTTEFGNYAPVIGLELQTYF